MQATHTPIEKITDVSALNQPNSRSKEHERWPRHTLSKPVCFNNQPPTNYRLLLRRQMRWTSAALISSSLKSGCAI